MSLFLLFFKICLISKDKTATIKAISLVFSNMENNIKYVHTEFSRAYVYLSARVH